MAWLKRGTKDRLRNKFPKRRSFLPPLSPVLGGEGSGVRGLRQTTTRCSPLTPNPSPPSTGERGERRLALSGSCFCVGPNLLLPSALVLLLNLGALRAEQPEPATDGAPPSASQGQAKKMPGTLLELIVAGGPVNIAFISVLGLFSLAGLAVILERLWNLTARKLMPAGLVRELQELAARKEDNPEVFQELCRRYPSCLANILKAGLLRAGRPLLEVEKGMEDAAARELAILRSQVRPLTILSVAAPLVGLLGTSVGMILVFRTVSQSGLGEAKLLAEGIYLKLETTVGGLLVAIPALLFAALFNSWSEKLLRRMDEHLMETIPCFIRMEQAQRTSEDRGQRSEVRDQKAVSGS